MQKKIPILLLWLLPFSTVFGQSVNLGFNTLAGTNDQLPFWLWANRLGQYNQNNSTIQHLSLKAFHQQQIGGSAFNIESGLNLDLLFADKNNIRFTQLFGSLSWKFLQVQIGAFPDEEVYAGLSTTNGNLTASRNARPHPRIRVGFNRFVPVIGNWFSIQGFYEEGLLNDNRYVKDTHLHRKAFYFRLGKPQSIEVTGGLEHFVMWGGTHPEYGKLQGWESYLDYVTGSTGDENALITDQLNVVGNGFGVYQFKLSKNWQKIHATFYLSHPFDDRSGMEWANYVDNLLGLHLAFQHEKALVKNLVLEFYHTKDQSGSYHLVRGDDGKNHGRGRDNYYNHGIYRSGATYNNMALVNPLFAPVIIEDGISQGFENTRFTGFHIGTDGLFNKNWYWKGLLTYTNNFGKHDGNGGSTYTPSRKQTSVLGEVIWMPEEKKYTIAASLAADHGSLYNAGISTTHLGAMLSFNYILK